MTPDERQLIEGLFKRMDAVPVDGKDRDAEALIQQSIRNNPHAPYVMVQALLIGEGALEGAQKRIQELEQQLAQAQRQPQQSSGGFLGGLFGSRNAPPAPQPTGYAPQGSPWGAPPQPGYHQGGWGQPQPGYGQPGYGQPQQPSFMRQALMTAAGVAGGVVVGSALMSMFSSSSAAAATGFTPGPDAAAGASDAAAGAIGGPVADSGWGSTPPAAEEYGQGGGWESADAGGGFDGGDSGDSGDW